MKVDLLIKNAQIVSARDTVAGCIAVKDGKIAAIADSPEGFEAARHRCRRKAGAARRH